MGGGARVTRSLAWVGIKFSMENDKSQKYQMTCILTENRQTPF